MSEISADYTELTRRIVASGLLRKQPVYYAFKAVSALAFLAFSVMILMMIDHFWVQVLNAIFFAFAFTQIGFLGHDAGHRQIFNIVRRNDFLGLSVNFLLGISRSWWVDQHNEHHTNPNVLEKDPHTNIPIIAFNKKQALRKTGFLQTIVQYQAFYFIPLLLLEGIGIRMTSIQFLHKGENVKYPQIEPILMVAHFVVYAGLVFFFMNVWQGILFITIHQAVFGLYLGSVFAPNHKGMLIPDETVRRDFIRLQVLTTRNLKGNRIIDFIYGGLNYQIEHHLFTNMPRNKLREAQKIVRAFLEERSIPYYESTFIESWREILVSLHEASAPLRQKISQEA